MLIDGARGQWQRGAGGQGGQLSRLIQTGHIYQYAFVMIIGVFLLLTFWFYGLKKRRSGDG